MAFLKVIKGSVPDQVLELTGDRTVLGRHPNCQIVLEDAAVSRHHAQILVSHGTYYLEDLHSRNHTFLNEKMVEGRQELKNGDTLRVCGVAFRFSMLAPKNSRSPDTLRPDQPGDSTNLGEQLSPPSSSNIPVARISENLLNSPALNPPVQSPPDEEASDDQPPEDKPPVDKSSIIGTLDVLSSKKLRLEVRAEAKLKALINVSSALGRRIRIDDVLAELLDQLFAMFPQAGFGVVLLKEDDGPELHIHTTRTFLPDAETKLTCSRTMVRHAIETGEAILSADTPNDEKYEGAESVNSLRIQSMMCVPLFNQEREAVGAIQIITRNTAQRFTQDDLELLASVGVQAALAVENARLHEEVLERRDMQRELDVATQIQHGFLPEKRPAIPGYEFFDYYEPALSVGGDYFDYIRLPDGRLAVPIADVAGKGIPAALLMARLYSAARFQFLTNDDPADAMQGLNSEIAVSGLGFRFITCAVAFLDAARGEITVCNAGHLFPLLQGVDGKVTQVGYKLSGMPLGVVPEQDFHKLTVAIRPGETLLLMTDGITEAMNPRNELYGTKRVTRFLEEFRGSPTELVDALVADVETFCEGRAQADDMCMVCLRRSLDDTAGMRSPLEESTTITDEELAADRSANKSSQQDKAKPDGNRETLDDIPDLSAELAAADPRQKSGGKSGRPQ